jgi:hypothetical protein
LTALLSKSAPASRPKAELVAATATGAPDATNDAQPAPHLLPFFGSPAVLKTLSGADADVTTLTPPARPREVATARDHQAADEAPPKAGRGERVRSSQKKPSRATKRATAQPPISIFGF